MNAEQMTIGLLIDELGEIEDKEKIVIFDFGGFYPGRIHSWRGAYDYPALSFHGDYNEAPSVQDLISELRQSILTGTIHIGWKGGEFCYDENSRLFVSAVGEANNTGISAVLDSGYHIVLSTIYCEY